MSGRLRHYVEPDTVLALCGWQPTAEELQRLVSGWFGHPGSAACPKCDRLRHQEHRQAPVR